MGISPLVPIDLGALFNEPWKRFLAPVEPAIQKLLQVDRLGGMLQSACRESGGSEAFERLLALLDVSYHVAPGDLARVPASGPLVVTANHPFGFLEAAILAAVLRRVRPDFKIVANSLLASVPELRSGFIFVNPYGGGASVRENRRPMRECLEWLAGGGVLALFPAGDVARIDWRGRGVVDPPWNPAVAHLIRLADCPALPVYFKGANGLGFQLIGALHPRLRTADLPRQTLNKRGRNIDVRIGRPVTAKALKSFPGEGEAIEYLRFRTFLLSCRDSQRAAGLAGFPLPVAKKRLMPLAAEMPREALIEETGRLAPVCENEEFAVYLAAAGAIPHCLREIGRLRELTFRSVGEGTGGPRDLDRFDPHYLHLFLWHKAAREVAGAYRLGPTADLLPRFGVRGLYSNTLFRLSPELFAQTGPALEMGRSFVRPEYQKQYAPLLLLWKGITRYVAAHPECAVLFGAVSISNDYNPVSRRLLVSYLETQKDARLAQFIRPRKPFRHIHGGSFDAQAITRFLKEVEELSAPIADLESDGKGVPILIKQYMKAGGRVLGFNIDPHFSHVLDVLMMADLRHAPRPVVDRFLRGRSSTRLPS
ncbi:MAG TPA: GNAT family N-acyltransferase [Bryobacteraceae bacterium]|nr:GNAT family N-acyltransferase [Bryobacteraceae bacterium]